MISSWVGAFLKVTSGAIGSRSQWIIIIIIIIMIIIIIIIIIIITKIKNKKDISK